MMAWIGISLRRLRDERASAAAFAVLVLVTALLAAVAPRALDRAADDTLRAELQARPVAPRSIQLLEQVRLPAGEGDPLAGPKAAGASLFASIPPPVQDVIAEQALVVEGGRWTVTKQTKDPSTLRMRIQPGAEGRIHFVAGRMPDATVQSTPVSTLEVALAASSAAALGVSVGDTLPLQLDGSDPLARFGGDVRATATVVGTFEVDRPDDPWWLGDPALSGPVIRAIAPDAYFLDMTALLAPEEYGEMLGVTPGGENQGVPGVPVPLRLTFREYVDPNRIRERDLGTLVAALRKLEATYPNANVPTTSFSPETPAVALRTALRSYLEVQAARWSTAVRILSVAAVGPGAVGLAAVGLAAVLAGRRRRATLSLASGRGASAGQVVRAVVAEGVLLGTPAAIAGAVGAVLLVPGDSADGALAVALAAIVVAVLALVIATVPGVAPAALGAGRELSRARPPSPRRLVVEGVVIMLAVVGAALLRDRGIGTVGGPADAGTTGGSTAIGTAAGGVATADPLMAAVPALVGLAAGLVAIRLLPILVAPLARLSRRARGLVPLLALRRAAAGGAGAIVLVLLATSTIGAFSVAALVDIDHAADTVAWDQVGADFRVTGAGIPLLAHFDFGALPGVEASATMYRDRATIVGSGTLPDLAAIDLEAYERVVLGTPGAAALPAELFGPPVEPLPIVVSDGLANAIGGVTIGDTIKVGVEGYEFSARVVASRATFPGMSDNSLFLIVNRAQLLGLFPTVLFQPSVAFLRAPPDAAPAIRQAITSAMSADVTGRVEMTTGLREAPIVTAIRAGIGAAAVVAAIYAALAVAVALALNGSARAIELAHLRTLGLSNGQASRLLLVEQVPAIAIAFVGGLGLGVGLFTALSPGLGLGALVGADVEIAPTFDASLLAATAAGLIATITLGLAFGMLAARSASPVPALRRGFE
jgi:putative ABC transport system permease protein